MESNVYNQNLIYEINIDNNIVDFSSTIESALHAAECEMVSLNETIDSINGLKPECDKLDYALAVSSGAICGILCCACFIVALGDSDIPLFQNIGKALVCDLIPFNRRCLIIGNDIADCGINFFKRIACADQHITEICLARTVGHGVFVHRKPRKRSA